MNVAEPISRLSSLLEAPHDQRAGIQVFTSLNVERVSKDLQLHQLGEERGKDNLPTTKSTSVDLVETSIQNRVVEHLRDQVEALRSQQDTYQARLAKVDLLSHSHSVITNAPSVQQFEAEKQRGIGELFKVGERVIETRLEREAFKKKNKLERVANPSNPGKKFVAFALLVFIFLVEAILNGTFLAEGNRFGLLGGTSLAAGFAFTNILVAWMSAKFLVRNILRRNIIWKLIGLLGLIFYLAFAVALNLALAHYRDLSTKFSDQLGIQVLEKMLSDPIGLTDVNSILLFVIGVAFSIIAFIDGWLWTDPFPGYANVEKRYVDAVAEYQDTRSDNIDGLEEIYQRSEEATHRALHKLDIAQAEQQAILGSHRTMLKNFDEFQVQLERDTNNLLQIYREANLKARSTKEPKCFQKNYALERFKPEEITTKAKQDADKAAVVKAKKQISNSKRGFEQAYREALEKYPSLQSLVTDG